MNKELKRAFTYFKANKLSIDKINGLRFIPLMKSISYLQHPGLFSDGIALERKTILVFKHIY